MSECVNAKIREARGCVRVCLSACDGGRETVRETGAKEEEEPEERIAMERERMQFAFLQFWLLINQQSRE